MWEEIVEVVARTDKAILVSFEGVEGWVPYSVIKDGSEIYERSEVGDKGTLCIPVKFAEKKGWMI